MSELVREPTDAEFSALLDEVAPNREQLENAPETPAAAEPEPAVAEGIQVPEKYQGKSEAELIQMHTELEKRLGQQGSELGGLRSELAQIQERLQQTPEETPAAPWDAPQFGYDALDEQVLTNPKQTLDYIVEHQPQLYDRAISTLASIDPFAAARYDNEQKLAAVRSEYEQQLAAVRTPLIADQNDRMLLAAVETVKNTNPLFEQHAEHIAALMEENPEFKVVIGNGDVQNKVRGLNLLVDIAATRYGQQGTTPAQAATAKKIAATVASPGSSAERGDKTAAQTLAERILAPEGTSVQDELARNRDAHAKRLAAR